MPNLELRKEKRIQQNKLKGIVGEMEVGKGCVVLWKPGKDLRSFNSYVLLCKKCLYFSNKIKIKSIGSISTFL